jgi:hypothetical protein
MNVLNSAKHLFLTQLFDHIYRCCRRIAVC